MTTTDEWIDETAHELRVRIRHRKFEEDRTVVIRAALQEAIERGEKNERGRSTAAFAAILSNEANKLRHYIENDCRGDDEVKQHARLVAEARLSEIDVLFSALAVTLTGQDNSDV